MEQELEIISKQDECRETDILITGELFKHFGFTPEKVVATVKATLKEIVTT